jgi:hypothetical protein
LSGTHSNAIAVDSNLIFVRSNLFLDRSNVCGALPRLFRERLGWNACATKTQDAAIVPRWGAAVLRPYTAEAITTIQSRRCGRAERAPRLQVLILR